ncbi:MAG: alanine--tRNA ligase [Gammaproteobacteria bacterium]|nr:alanine--tRNA ligase [Gammaproteobacteria bacterium]MBU1926603.1 alanine--tRNA ligase [Gammaproteobacteria bacterium]
MKTNQLRQTFLNYFKEHAHTVVPSSSLVPGNDPTLLFTNAGMVQFKDVFLGYEKRPYVRAASVQRCMRAGGKHNDLENVGYTARHHTFFEMLGNFSFGDYFKREAIQFAWTFLTEVLGLPKERLWVTVFEEDDETANIWLKEMGIDPDRFSRCGEKDNFWSMGDTGPCGPCSEIFYDHGPEIAGGPPGSADEDGDRYIELWNLVFMQFNRDTEGKLSPLPKPSVDTGMGLERVAAVLQGVHNNYEIDLFQVLIKEAARLTRCKDLNHPALKVITDHIRSCAFLIVDGVTPSNEGRGYVFRRIIRRAIRHGNKLGVKKPFFYKLVSTLVKVMSDAYPELAAAQKLVETVLLREEEQFATTLQQGLKILEADMKQVTNNLLSGETVFKLFDTYGFPVDLTALIAAENAMQIDEEGFLREMEKQRQRSQAASQFQVVYNEHLQIDRVSEFTGYESLARESVVIAVFKQGKAVDRLEPEEEGVVVLDRTPFYAESGGQIGDIGEMRLKDGLFLVTNTQKLGAAIMHDGILKTGVLRVGDTIEAQINVSLRKATSLNHSATHLLQAALKQVLGDHVLQKGSFVNPHRLRFDFAHFKPVTFEELRLVESIVNEKIRENLSVETHEMSLEEAKQTGATALFGEKYGERVRVLAMGDFSVELCGGTHVQRTGDIGLFKIMSETGVAAGVRRIEALTGDAALQYVNQDEIALSKAANMLKTNKEFFVDKLEQTLQQIKDLERERSQFLSQQALLHSDTLLKQVKQVNGVDVLAALVTGVDVKGLRDLLDQLKNQLKKAVIVLAVVPNDQTVHVIGGVTENLTDRFHAGKLVKEITTLLGGKGGGRADMAQGGGDQPKQLNAALAFVEKYVGGNSD